ncbi:S8 family serine peptidase [Microbacterium caowuchunii]|uniref:S8 family serine peptidase n=1 Tax=Microbacterium caowuchunii TaxID=2614638 RepID=UPI0012445BE6|nr:S8 family serine peptidase [Microbacterium caowuchunii]QEW00819.1 S8 family serine peptidase [Microbacterium caowuchunii]
MIGAGVVFGGTAASAVDEPGEIIPSLADALAEAADDGAAGAAELADAVGLPDAGPGSLRVDADGDVAATVTFTGRPSDADLAAVRALATVGTVYRFTPAAAVTVAPELLDDLADLPGVLSVTPVLAPTVGSGAKTAGAATGILPTASGPATDCRAFPSDAVGPLGVDLARDTFGVDGTGVTVGILSDSYASANPAGPAADVAAGVLPGPGNPCGYETPVAVLADLSGAGTDEGRGMAQLVHGIAPAAEIMFYTGYTGMEGMAEGIVALAEAGADVIVDDIGYFNEPHFQQSVISAAISHVQEMGVAYYTSAGNQNVIGREGSSAGLAIGAWETSAFRGTACPSWVVSVPAPGVTWDCLDFDPNGAGDPTDTLFFDDPTSPQPTVSWAEPVYGAESILIPQLYVDQGTGYELASQPISAIPQNPVVVAGLNPAHPTVEGDVELVVLRGRDPGAAPSSPAVWTAFWGGTADLAAREHDTSVGTDRVGMRATGHSSDGSAIAVAAANWRTPDQPERFTSPGAGDIYFEPVAFGPDALPVPSPAYPQPLTVPGPQIAAVDGNRTSFFGGTEVIDGETQHFFFGTSAAAPNAAAVHALALEYAPDTSADDITQAAFATAAAMDNPLASSLSDEEYFGAGLIDANALLGELPPHAATGLGATALSESSIAVEWDATAGATGYRIEVLAGGAPVTSIDTDAATTATTVTGLESETAYTVRLSVIGATVTGPAVTVEVTTLRPAEPAGTPATPSAAGLTPEPTPGLVATPSHVQAGGTVTVTGLPPRTWVYGWLFSEPTALGWAWTGSSGAATLSVPAAVPAGAHRLAVAAADGTLLGWVALDVTAPAAVPAAAVLARTGFGADLAPATAFGALALLIGAGLVALSGRRLRRASR